jgi:acetyltransferase-like isoleucine patch superfamily enzyme
MEISYMRHIQKLSHRARKAMRQGIWRQRLARLGAQSDIQAGAHFEYAANIELGARCCVGRHALLRANTPQTPGIRLGDRAHVGELTLINANGGQVTIGSDSWVGPHSVIYGNGGVCIGRNVMIANHCAINTVSHHSDRTDIPMREQGIYCEPVIIEDDVWVGVGAIILQGVRIGRGSIIGAGALVNSDVGPNSIAIGVPARVTGNRTNDLPIAEFQNGAMDRSSHSSCH